MRHELMHHEPCDVMNASAGPEAARPNARLGLLLALGFVLLWAVMEWLVARLHRSYDLVQVEAWRFAVQLLLMLLVWHQHGVRRLWQTRRPVSQFTRAVVMLAVPLGFEVALSHGGTVPLAQLGLWLAPLWALVLARLWLRDAVPAPLWAAGFIGCAGACLLIGMPRSGSAMAVLVSGFIGVALAVYLAVTRSLRFEAVQTNLFLLALGSFVVLSPLLPWVWVMPDLHDAVLLSGLGLVGYLALWLLEQALRRVSLPRVAPVLYAHLVGLVGVSSLLRMRGPGLWALAGMGLVIAVVVWSWRRVPAHDAKGSATALAAGTLLGLGPDTEGGAL